MLSDSARRIRGRVAKLVLFSLAVGIHMTAQELIRDVVAHHKSRNQDSTLDPERLVLKVSGRKQFLAGDTVVCSQKVKSNKLGLFLCIDS